MWHLEPGSALAKSKYNTLPVWYLFTRPVHIITTHQFSDVVTSIQQAEEFCQKGYFVVGMLSYESSFGFNSKMAVHPPSDVPLVWFGCYAEKQIVDLSDFPMDAVQIDSLQWKPELEENDYRQTIEKIKNYLLQGDTYQVNFTYRTTTDFEYDPFAFFLTMNRNQQSDYSMYLNIGSHIFLSASPELFFYKKSSNVTCKPMKGTCPRGFSYREDQSQKEKLLQSEKQRAENVMIVDMIRNDLGKIAAIGSVFVDKLFEVETYPTIHQLTSTIRAEVECTWVELFSALFPCASITGAPKIRTMEIIHELETSPRGAYCGSMGFADPNEEMQFQVSIRTITIRTDKKSAEFGTGGGIVWDSDSQDEWQETETKMKFLHQVPRDFSLLETMLWKQDYGILYFEEHLERLRESSEYFQFSLDEAFLLEKLNEYQKTITKIESVLRLQINQKGEILLEEKDVPISKEFYLIRIATHPIDTHTPFIFHKTTNRSIYEPFLNEITSEDDVLLWNVRGELTETTRFNLVVQQDGKLFTPSIESGLLNGCMRRNLMKQDQVIEKIIQKDSLHQFEQIYLINSVREWCKAQLV